MLRLVADCCRPTLDTADLALLAPRLANADGERLRSVANRHRVEGLVWRTVRRAGILVPGAGALAADARTIAADNLRLAVESDRLHQVFRRASLPHLFLKGQPLAMLAWGDEGIKRQIDIDLLVLPEAIGKAAALLDALGYVPQEPEPSVDPADWHRRRKESLWRSDEGVLVDLHSRVADHPALLPTLTAALPPRMVEVAGGMALPTVPERLLLPYLAVHGCSSAWFRLKWLADFAAVAMRMGAEQRSAAARSAARVGAGRTIAAAFILANRVLATPLVPDLEADRATLRLVDLSLRMLKEPGEPTERRFGTLPIHRAQLLMVPGSHYFLGEVVRQLGAALIR